MSGRKPIIIVRDLYVNFYTYAGVVKAIDGVSFDALEGGDFLPSWGDRLR